MPRPTLPSVEDHLDRVVDETNKAACYLAAAMASRLIPRLHDRLDESPTQLAFVFLRQGVHMAFLSTLAAVLEDTRDPRIVNLPKLLRLLQNEAVRRAIATRRGIAQFTIDDQVDEIQTRFDRRVRPHIAHARDLRNNVVAHHGVRIAWPRSTYRVLTLLMIRVVVLVDAVSELMTGVQTNVRMNMSTVRWQAASLLSKGIDGDPDVASGPVDNDD